MILLSAQNIAKTYMDVYDSMILSKATMPDKLITLACIGVAVAVYAVLLLALGAVERDDVLLLPKGEKIA